MVSAVIILPQEVVVLTSTTVKIVYIDPLQKSLRHVIPDADCPAGQEHQCLITSYAILNAKSLFSFLTKSAWKSSEYFLYAIAFHCKESGALIE
jgi:hypothetical protein